MIIGIDIGGTTTDAVAFKNGRICGVVSVIASDPMTAAAGALGKLVDKLEIPLSDISVIAATGVGVKYLGKDMLLGIPLVRVDEFTSLGTAGAYLTDTKEAIVVSMGTGTAFVCVKGEDISHWGGSGVGGGTISGLSRLILNISSIETLAKKAEGGALGNIDLFVGDISPSPIDNLPKTATASNFGKVSDEATDNDKALAIINLVCQSIGVMATYAARANNINNIILTGKLTRLRQAKKIVGGVGDLFGIDVYVPENAEYATAIGAAIHIYKKEGV